MDSTGREAKLEVIRAYADAFNRGDIDALCGLFTTDAQIFGVLGYGGLDKARPIWSQLIACFKMQLQIESAVVEGDTVAVRYIERGTFSAPYRDVPPTGKSYEVAAMEWFVLRGGKIHQRWGARDSASIFRQLGIPPA
jgi:steroid delta-isomerase-like uncharacterized protein